jgi:hypothetical protein
MEEEFGFEEIPEAYDENDGEMPINLYEWAKMADKYRAGEIDRQEYDNWRYNLKAFTTEE